MHQMVGQQPVWFFGIGPTFTACGELVGNLGDQSVASLSTGQRRRAALAAVALREAAEETGISGLRVWPVAVDLDIHEVDPPTEDAHLHYDVRFVVRAPEGSVVAANHESQAQRWVRPDELASLGADAGLRRLAEHGLRLARENA